MKEVLSGMGKFLLDALKALDWKKVLHSACKSTLLPMVKKMADSTESKIDDAIYIGLERLVDVFLAPPVTPVPLVEVK